MSTYDNPSRMTDEIKSKLIGLIRAGNYAKIAAECAGIHPSTFHRWMARGAKDTSGPYRQFHDEIKAAENYAEAHTVALLRKEMPGNWRAQLAYLEHKHPDRWSARKRPADQASPLDSPPGSPQTEPETPASDTCQYCSGLVSAGMKLPTIDEPGAADFDHDAGVFAILFEAGVFDNYLIAAAAGTGATLTYEDLHRERLAMTSMDGVAGTTAESPTRPEMDEA